MNSMSTLLHIRKDVLAISQAEMAAIARTSQATVSRWENGELQPDLRQMKRIRAFALERGLSWDDSLFFDVPPAEAQAEEAA